MYAPTGTNPLRECKRRMRKSCFFRNPEREPAEPGAEGGEAFISCLFLRLRRVSSQSGGDFDSRHPAKKAYLMEL
jgi:hypothetical protein